MCIRMIYNVTTFKNVFQYQMAYFNNAKLKLLFHQSNVKHFLYPFIYQWVVSMS